jgi:hypothetical protein
MAQQFRPGTRPLAFAMASAFAGPLARQEGAASPCSVICQSTSRPLSFPQRRTTDFRIKTTRFQPRARLNRSHKCRALQKKLFKKSFSACRFPCSVMAVEIQNRKPPNGLIRSEH